METKNILLVVIVVIALIALVMFLISRNRKDIKTMNPDSEDSVKETHGDAIRREDKM